MSLIDTAFPSPCSPGVTVGFLKSLGLTRTFGRFRFCVAFWRWVVTDRRPGAANLAVKAASLGRIRAETRADAGRHLTAAQYQGG
jgi:hypothetical protein